MKLIVHKRVLLDEMRTLWKTFYENFYSWRIYERIYSLSKYLKNIRKFVKTRSMNMVRVCCVTGRTGWRSDISGEEWLPCFMDCTIIWYIPESVDQPPVTVHRLLHEVLHIYKLCFVQKLQDFNARQNFNFQNFKRGIFQIKWSWNFVWTAKIPLFLNVWMCPVATFGLQCTSMNICKVRYSLDI